MKKKRRKNSEDLELLTVEELLTQIDIRYNLIRQLIFTKEGYNARLYNMVRRKFFEMIEDFL